MHCVYAYMRAYMHIHAYMQHMYICICKSRNWCTGYRYHHNTVKRHHEETLWRDTMKRLCEETPWRDSVKRHHTYAWMDMDELWIQKNQTWARTQGICTHAHTFKMRCGGSRDMSIPTWHWLLLPLSSAHNVFVCICVYACEWDVCVCVCVMLYNIHIYKYHYVCYVQYTHILIVDIIYFFLLLRIHAWIWGTNIIFLNAISWSFRDQMHGV